MVAVISLVFSHLLDAGGDGGDDQHQGEAHHGPVLSHPSMDWTNIFWYLIAMFHLDLRRSLWLQRRRLRIQQWVKSVAVEKLRRHGTRCSWEDVFESKPAERSNLLKTIFTSAWLISPVLSINNFQSWISYSKSCLLPVKITPLAISLHFSSNDLTQVLDTNTIAFHSNKLLCETLQCKDHVANLPWNVRRKCSDKSTCLCVKWIINQVEFTGKLLVVFSLQVQRVFVGAESVVWGKCSFWKICEEEEEETFTFKTLRDVVVPWTALKHNRCHAQLINHSLEKQESFRNSERAWIIQ